MPCEASASQESYRRSVRLCVKESQLWSLGGGLMVNRTSRPVLSTIAINSADSLPLSLRQAAAFFAPAPYTWQEIPSTMTAFRSRSSSIIFEDPLEHAALHPAPEAPVHRSNTVALTREPLP